MGERFQGRFLRTTSDMAQTDREQRFNAQRTSPPTFTPLRHYETTQHPPPPPPPVAVEWKGFRSRSPAGITNPSTSSSFFTVAVREAHAELLVSAFSTPPRTDFSTSISAWTICSSVTVPSSIVVSTLCWSLCWSLVSRPDTTTLVSRACYRYRGCNGLACRNVASSVVCSCVALRRPTAGSRPDG